MNGFEYELKKMSATIFMLDLTSSSTYVHFK